MDLENQDRTKTISDNLNPVWNHSSYFRVYREDDDPPKTLRVKLI